MKKSILTIAVLAMSVLAQAKTMSCVIGVYRANDMKEDSKPENSTKVVEVSLDNEGVGELDVKINNEDVSISLYKREFADVYDMNVVLMTPKEDRVGGAPYVTGLGDFLINSGPAKDNGWTVNPRPGAILYEYLKRPSGTMVITPKLQKALQANGMWGKHPFTRYEMEAQYGSYVAEAVQKLIQSGALKDTDVLALSTIFSCTENK